jgi:phosphopantetheine adenylyltransferase
MHEAWAKHTRLRSVTDAQRLLGHTFQLMHRGHGALLLAALLCDRACARDMRRLLV